MSSFDIRKKSLSQIKETKENSGRDHTDSPIIIDSKGLFAELGHEIGLRNLVKGVFQVAIDNQVLFFKVQ